MSDQTNLYKTLTELSLQLSSQEQAPDSQYFTEPNPFINGPIVIVNKSVDTEWAIVFISANITLFGFPERLDQWNKKDYADLIHPDDINRVRNEIGSIIQSNKTTGRLHYRLQCPDQVNRWIEDFLIILRDDDGQPVRYFSFLQDLSHSKQAEERFRILYEIAHQVNSSASLEELLYQIHQSIRTIMFADNFYVAIYNEQTKLVSFPYFVDQYDQQPPPRAKKKGLTEYVILTGEPMLFTPETQKELIAQGVIEVIGTPPECWLGIPLKIRKHTIGAIVLQSYDSAKRYNQSDINLLGAMANEIAFAVERKQSSQEYYRQSEWLKVTLASIGDAVIACDTQSRVIFMNQIAANLTGWSPENAIGQTINEVFRIERDLLGAGRRDQPLHPRLGRRGIPFALHAAQSRVDARTGHRIRFFHIRHGPLRAPAGRRRHDLPFLALGRGGREGICRAALHAAPGFYAVHPDAGNHPGYLEREAGLDRRPGRDGVDPDPPGLHVFRRDPPGTRGIPRAVLRRDAFVHQTKVRRPVLERPAKTAGSLLARTLQHLIPPFGNKFHQKMWARM